jgi:hypothetical protein
MKRIDWNQLDAAGRKAALARPQRRTESAVAGVVRVARSLKDMPHQGYRLVLDRLKA